MTVTDQVKILHSKIIQNEAQYDLDRKAAKICALSSNNLYKYEYLTGQDLGSKPSTVEQGKFEYFPLRKIFTKRLDKDDQKEGLFKRPCKECRKILRGEKKIIEGFKEKIFPIYCDETLEEEARYEEEEKNITNENGLINYKKLARLIDFKIRDLNDELVREYFLVQDLGSLLEKLRKS